MDVRRRSRTRVYASVAALTVAIVAAGSAAALAKPPVGPPKCSKRTPCDATPPTVAISIPTPGALAAGTVTVSGVASDNVGLQSVAVEVDAASRQAATGTSTWTDRVDTTAYADGTHTLTAVATDTAGNVGTASLTINVSNPVAPSPSPTPSASPTTSPSASASPVGSPVPAPSMAPGTIGGWIWQESDRDGMHESTEQPLGNQHLYLYTGAGAYVGNTYSDASGWYAFGGLADGAYRVQLAPDSWWSIRDDWVPDTTGSVYPRAAIQLNGTARIDLGWRPIVRSTTQAGPISSYVGPNGLSVESYDDVVAARDVYDRLMQGGLVGPESAYATIRFDAKTTSTTSTMTIETNGAYSDYHATSYVDYDSWLDGDGALFHEYGHAWSLYYAYMVRQDPTLSAYLDARGLLGDPRVGTSYAWDPREMIAEDYRQLFGTPSAQAETQMNRDVPPANQVPGLESFLRDTFTAAPA
jgi:hypothetical protein